jgi:hypothetical protein
MTTDTTAESDFANTLFKATLGNSDAIGEIIRMYLPLIDHLSTVNGKIDEDMRQELFLHLIRKIRKFSLL